MGYASHLCLAGLSLSAKQWYRILAIQEMLSGYNGIQWVTKRVGNSDSRWNLDASVQLTLKPALLQLLPPMYTVKHLASVSAKAWAWALSQMEDGERVGDPY